MQSLGLGSGSIKGAMEVGKPGPGKICSDDFFSRIGRKRSSMCLDYRKKRVKIGSENDLAC